MTLKKLTDDFGDSYVVSSLPLEIKVKTHGNVSVPVVIFNGDWVDLCSAEDVILLAGESAKISLGISMQLPQGYEAHIVPRSSTYGKWGILQTNGIGIVDNSYCGDKDIWLFPVIAMRDTEIKEGDRICQFRIIEKQPLISFVIFQSLENKNRGGFGSTG